MAVTAQDEGRAASLRRLHGLVRAVNADLDLDRTLRAVCQGLVEGLGFEVAAVNLVVPGGHLEVVACEGDAGARAQLLGTRASRQEWDALLARCQPVGALLVDYDHLLPVDDGVPSWVPDRPALDVEGAWDPQDELFAPLRTSGSGLLGVLSVDLPRDGLRPGPEQLELLEMYAAQVSVALENARLHGELRAQAAERARALERLGAIVDSAPVGIVELDLQGRVLLWSDGAQRIFGWTEQEVSGSLNPVAAGGAVELDLLDGAPLRRRELSRPRKDGSLVDVEMSATALRDADGAPYGYLGVYSDVTSRLRLEQELRTAAFTDALTGLDNRAAFTAALAAAPPGACVLLLDLDGFKAVNDTLGHDAGDAVLVEVARRLRAECRAGDLVARLGGDEFVVLLAPERGAVAALSQRLVEVLAEPFALPGRQVALGASVGLASAGVGSDAASLLRDADVAMYAAKGAGKGRVQVFEPALRHAVVERAELVEELRRGLRAGQVTTRWHPVADVACGRLRGLEALARWQHPQRGELLPQVFIHLAEQTGLVVTLGEQILHQACTALRQWQPLLPGLLLSVNVSPVQLRHPGFVDSVQAVLRDTGAPAACLVLELTEDVLLHDLDAGVAVLGELRRLGVRLALDDFGAGYSSFLYLKRLPVDIVKLDRALLLGADSDPAALALLDAVVQLVRRLGLRAVAEGVETPGQWQALRRIGCHLAQGFLLAPPLHPRDVPDLLRTGWPSSRVPRLPRAA